MNKLKNSIELRAHHLLCLLNFQGLGYNRLFVKNMEKVKNTLLSNPEISITLTSETDIICSACPHNIGGCCKKRKDSEKKVEKHDLKVMKMFGFKKGKELKASQVFQEIEKNISPKNISEVCPKCEWLNVCQNSPKFNSFSS